jgi:hypothetical protein
LGWFVTWIAFSVESDAEDVHGLFISFKLVYRSGLCFDSETVIEIHQSWIVTVEDAEFVPKLFYTGKNFAAFILIRNFCLWSLFLLR